MLNLQHQHNNHTTTPHMMVDPTHWDPPSCEGLLYSCCDNKFTTPTQQPHNNPSHDGGPHTLGPTIM